MTLKMLTYSSFASAGLQPAELGNILSVARRNNARDAITGTLMFNGASFLQTIEGPPASIDRLVMAIECDPRHSNIEVHFEEARSKRSFPEWVMGYVRLDDGGLEGQYEVAEALSCEMSQAVRDVMMAMAITLPFG